MCYKCKYPIIYNIKLSALITHNITFAIKKINFIDLLTKPKIISNMPHFIVI